jgi:predicted Co/Zn/Cd cation transporter (cation efflux family)
VSTGFVALYSFLIGIICFVIAIVQSGMSRRLHSLLVKVDARNWLIDGIISVGIAAGFLIAALLNRTKLDWMVAYADPVIVILIVLATASLPIHIIGSSLKQLLLAAPKEALQGKAEAVIESTLADFPVAAKRLRMVEVGRYVYMLLTVVIPENESGMGIGKTDTMRSKIYTSVTDAIPNSDIDVYFTTDRRWID